MLLRPTPASVPLRWSEPPDAIARMLENGQHPVAFAIEFRQRFKRRRVDFVFTPLGETHRMGAPAFELIPATGPEPWLVWQTVTGRGCLTPLPTSGDDLANRLGLWPYTDGGAPARYALSCVMDALYAARAY